MHTRWRSSNSCMISASQFSTLVLQQFGWFPVLFVCWLLTSLNLFLFLFLFCPPALYGLSAVPVWIMYLQIRPGKVKVSNVHWPHTVQSLTFVLCEKSHVLFPKGRPRLDNLEEMQYFEASLVFHQVQRKGPTCSESSGRQCLDRIDLCVLLGGQITISCCAISCIKATLDY